MESIVIDSADQNCQHTIGRDGYCAVRENDISPGCSHAPPGQAAAKLPGICSPRLMDDGVILAESRWMLRGVARVMKNGLRRLQGLFGSLWSITISSGSAGSHNRTMPDLILLSPKSPHRFRLLGLGFQPNTRLR